jgi:hypothetical protein
MGDLGSLLGALAVIYVLECLVWVQRGSVLLLRWWGKTSAIHHPGTLLGNARGALFLANPFPPFGTAFLGRPILVSLSVEGALSWTAACLNPGWRPAQAGRYVRFDEMRSVEVEGKSVRVDGHIFIRAPSPYVARTIAGNLRRLQKAPGASRRAIIQSIISEALDRKSVNNRMAALAGQSRWLRSLGIGLFWYLFGAAPLLVWHFGLGPVVWPIAGGLLAQTVAIAILFHRAHKTLYPAAGEERFTPFLTMLLAPPAAIRAVDVLRRPLLEDFHPLAAAAVLASRDHFKAFARHVLLDLRHPILPACPSNNLQAVATEREFRETLCLAAEEFVQSAGCSVKELLQPPQRTDPTHASYCPRCGAQFVVREGVCADCGGRALVAF